MQAIANRFIFLIISHSLSIPCDTILVLLCFTWKAGDTTCSVIIIYSLKTHFQEITNISIIAVDLSQFFCCAFRHTLLFHFNFFLCNSSGLLTLSHLYDCIQQGTPEDDKPILLLKTETKIG